MKVTINLDHITGRFPLYDGGGGFELDTRTGELTLYNSDSTGGVPEDVWNNTVLRFIVSPYTLREDILYLAKEFEDFFNMVLNDEAEYTDWYGHSHGYTAESAIISLEDTFGVYPTPTTKKELEELVSDVMALDGDDGYYLESQYSFEELYEKALEHFVEYIVFKGEDDEELSPQLAQLVLDSDISLESEYYESLVKEWANKA